MPQDRTANLVHVANNSGNYATEPQPSCQCLLAGSGNFMAMSLLDLLRILAFSPRLRR